MVLIAKTGPIVAPPTERFPHMLTKDGLANLIEEAATTDGVKYEFCAPLASESSRAIGAQR